MQEPRRRADARRNAERIAHTAIAAFEETGSELRLEDVATRAGVGIATVYRLFGGREGLVRAAFETFFVGEIEPLADVARATQDPSVGLRTALAATLDTLAA